LQKKIFPNSVALSQGGIDIIDKSLLSAAKFDGVTVTELRELLKKIPLESNSL
jgi:hypothetical protein